MLSELSSRNNILGFSFSSIFDKKIGLSIKNIITTKTIERNVDKVNFMEGGSALFFLYETKAIIMRKIEIGIATYRESAL